MKSTKYGGSSSCCWLIVLIVAVVLGIFSETCDSFLMPTTKVQKQKRQQQQQHPKQHQLVTTSWPSSSIIVLGSCYPNDETEKDVETTLFMATTERNNKNNDTLPLNDIVKKIEEKNAVGDSYEIHVGRALDTLRKDYPQILTESPDFVIYDKNVEIVDPSGVKLHGVSNYKKAFGLLHAIVNIFYCPDRSSLTFKLCYDTARHNIRVAWNAEVVPKAIFGGVRTTLHVDGISVYEIHSLTGKITQHRIEHLLINNLPVMPQQGIIAALRNEHQQSIGTVLNVHPSTNSIMSTAGAGLFPTSTTTNNNNNLQGNGNPHIVQFQKWDKNVFNKDELSLFSMTSTKPGDGQEDPTSTSSASTSAVPAGAGSTAPAAAIMDWEAYEKKNKLRKKFGLKPLSPEEYLQTEEEIKAMKKVAQQEQEQRRAALLAASELAKKQKEKAENGNVFEKLFGNVLKDTCESNYDCERPEVCCDLGFKKMCCSSGMRVLDGPQNARQPALVPVPVDVGYPPNRGPDIY